MAAAKKGMKPVLVNVNSFGGRIPLRSMPAYTASKYALAGFTDAIRPDFADQGIHVAQVHPGISAMPLRSNWHPLSMFSVNSGGYIHDHVPHECLPRSARSYKLHATSKGAVDFPRWQNFW